MKKTADQIVDACAKNILREIAVWKNIQENGCNDPFWTDGCNMNLTRNHVLSYKQQIRELCEENNISLPEEYYLPTPPEVENNYMATLKQKKRVKRLKQQGIQFSRKKLAYDLAQQSLF